MKFIRKFSIFVLLILTIQIFSKNLAKPETQPATPANPSDPVYSRILEYINQIAEKKMKSSDLMAKKKLSGSLPEGFSDDTIKAALATRNNKNNWKSIMDIPTEIYRICLYPTSKVNYTKWCSNSFFGSKPKLDSKLIIYNI